MGCTPSEEGRRPQQPGEQRDEQQGLSIPLFWVLLLKVWKFLSIWDPDVSRTATQLLCGAKPPMPAAFYLPGSSCHPFQNISMKRWLGTFLVWVMYERHGNNRSVTDCPWRYITVKERVFRFLALLLVDHKLLCSWIEDHSPKPTLGMALQWCGWKHQISSNFFRDLGRII